jgi:dihydrolipoamide dehydrogenase
MGIKVSKPKADIKQMLKFKDEAIEGNTKGIEFLLKKTRSTRFTAPARYFLRARLR